MPHHAGMTQDELSRLLQHAATATPAEVPAALEGSIMARVRADTGRARRWWRLTALIVLLAVTAGVATAAFIGWTRAVKDPVHAKPPAMPLFKGGPL
jgi:hypothetical protein